MAVEFDEFGGGRGERMHAQLFADLMAAVGLSPDYLYYLAESVKEHVEQAGEETNLGAGNQEPDPATAANPPQDIKARDAKRKPT